MITQVVNIVHENYDVYVARPSKWGNPFIIGKDGTRKEVIEKYEMWIRQQPELMNSLHELDGKKLGCYCSPKNCHADVLIMLIKEWKDKQIFEE